ncbi:MAG: glycosyltransferase family 2 protein, partial [Bacteroidales bacterium]|nr:glycosyltransferase family 2 protein [Bacteroidales bacterium]
MSKLSVTIITFNEEQNIARCLEAIKPVADEIIVVDSFSTDKTKVICQQFGVQFYEHPFTNYIEQKNLATSYTSYDYILNVDADEVLTHELQQSILTEKENFRYDAYFINRLTNYCGQFIKHGGWYPDRKLRLWNKLKGKWAGELIHEDIALSGAATTGNLEGNLLHYSYHSIAQHIEQINRFTNLT